MARRLFPLALWGLLLLTATAQAAVTFDAAAEGNSGINLSPGVSYSITIGNNPDRALFVGLCTANGTFNEVTGASHNTDALTLIARTHNTPSIVNVYLYRLVNPTIGAQQINFSLSTDRRMASGAISLHGVSQTTPFDGLQVTQNAADTASISVAVTTEAGDMVVDVGCKRGSGNLFVMGVQTNRVERYNEASTTGVAGNNPHIGGSTRTGTGALTMDWSNAGGGLVGLTLIGINVNEVVGGAGGSSPGFLLLGR